MTLSPTPHAPGSEGNNRQTPWVRSVLLGAAGSAIVTLMVLAFLWPIVTASPRDLPLVVAGPSAQTAVVTEAIDEQSKGLFAMSEAADRDAAIEAITRREAYGAIVLGERPEVLVSSAASPVVAQQMAGVAGQLRQMLAQQLQAGGGDPAALQVPLTDVVPLSADDPNGAGIAAAAFPLTLGGMIGGMLVSFGVAGSLRRSAALGVYAVAAGLLVAAVLQPWFGVLQGSFWLNALAIGLAMFATGALIVGLTSLIGRPGAILGAILTLLLGNPLSGVNMPHQFLVGPWGDIGQGFVPGAASSLIRGISYFPDAPAGPQWLTLVMWSAAGLALLGIGGMMRARTARNAVTANAAAPNTAPRSA